MRDVANNPGPSFAKGMASFSRDGDDRTSARDAMRWQGATKTHVAEA